MFKNQLQEYAQKAGLPIPIYDVTNEGLSHRPQFKASVKFQEKVYETPASYTNSKKAEQAAAEVALAALGKLETKGLYESGLCKSILQEYAQKIKSPLPVYNVVPVDKAKSPAFIASVEVGGARYEGGQSRTRKEAKIKAARAALSAIYSDPATSQLGDIEDPAVVEPRSATGEVQITGIHAAGKRSKKVEESGELKKPKIEEPIGNTGP
ncbi:hypothetical protein KP509_02G065300 [Ceratopteris richardii]|uniref:DRBM domain-containing protein n=1 Tax=Ceratopteris richardii TaxID=49495 RepID=A0A8T2VI32_CERRI|nr:hypothetical protein KP509_02G065300 [Ceratopteris richardii]KAH7444120.1 hypothetical protein KP509_02G065300 [Ceratopteris richardii]